MNADKWRWMMSYCKKYSLLPTDHCDWFKAEIAWYLRGCVCGD